MKGDAMRARRLGVALMAVAVLMWGLPAAAVADPFVSAWSIIGLRPVPSPSYHFPQISGDNIVFGQQVPGENIMLERFSLVTGSASLFQSPPDGQNMLSASISGDWVVWKAGPDIGAKNIKTGAVKRITNYSGMVSGSSPSVSTASGAYVVWMRSDSVNPDVMGKNLATNGSVFTIAGGPQWQAYPSIYGKRVAYVLDDGAGNRNIYVKTIGSSAAPRKITNNDLGPLETAIGDHLVVWRIRNGSGRLAIRYYDYDTGLTYDGPSSTEYDMQRAWVSGDRILYGMATGPSDMSLHVWDTRIARTSASAASLTVASAVEYESYAFDGGRITYASGDEIYYARLAIPSISLNAVPTRIPHLGHIHLTGSISDLGVRIGGAKLGVERYASGKWTRIKTLTASATGTFSYQTPHNHAKTKYRVVYDGQATVAQVPWTNHLSTRSAVKTAWPR
jgi:hypothetical protein